MKEHMETAGTMKQQYIYIYIHIYIYIYIYILCGGNKKEMKQVYGNRNNETII